MNVDPELQRFRWPGRLTLPAIALALLLAAAPLEKTPYPQLMSTVPARGATDVDPAIQEIRITFDRDMSPGMSWTGGGEVFPPTDKALPPKWIDQRTCVLPVQLAAGSFYRVGINARSFHNFKATDGTPVPPDVVYFATRDASKEVAARVEVPKVVELEPANDATDVDPSITTLRVTFDMPMGEGMSWTGGGENFPRPAEGKQAKWSQDGHTCTLPVVLEPGHEYELGLNSLSHNNFQSKWGVPLEPVTYRFRTADGK